MEVRLDGGLDPQRKIGGGKVTDKNRELPLNLVLSYGDLAPFGGYRTRVLGELNALDRQDSHQPFLLVFDRNPERFERTFQSDIPHRALRRSAVLQFPRALRHLARQRPIRLVHAHNLYSAALALSVRWRHGYKIVLDYHGRIPEEYAFLGKGGQGSRRMLELLERWCVTHADHIVVVSHKLADYLIGRYKLAHEVSVIPCCADETIFRWDVVRREKTRAMLNLAGKFVCAHLGSFFEWYEPEMIVEAFRQIRACVDSHLLVITGNTEKAHAYLAARLPETTFTVQHAAHDEVPALLNASDLGLLLLRPSPNIKTSSPAKFAEYLNSGLPVLITPEVGDFSEIVARADVGAVYKGRDGTSLEILAANRSPDKRAEIAERCMAAGRQLTWQAFSQTWTQIVASLCEVRG